MARVGNTLGGADCSCAACIAAQGDADGAAAGGITSGDPIDPALAAAVRSSSGGWARTALTFSFADAVPSYYATGASERDGFLPLTAAQRAGVRAALAEIEKATGLRFAEDTNPADGWGDLVFGAARLPDGVGGWGYVPQSSLRGGDVWLSTAFRNNGDPTPGSAGFARLLHEIGHAIGMKHSGDYDSTGKDTDGPFLPVELDTRQHTVMAYDPHPAYADTRPATPMPLDVVALQQLYGANGVTGAGNDVYRWAAGAPVIATVWDAGGIDTFDAGNHASGVAIDLRPGAYSSIGVDDDGGPGRHNVAIAFGVTIENAIGGSGGDRIVGNNAANRLDGGAGADTLTGAAGDDMLIGGAGADVAIFAGERGAHALRWDGAWLVVSGPDGIDRLSGIERLAFADGTIDAPAATPPALRFADVTVTEGAREHWVSVPVTLDRPADGPVVVAWTTWGLTATKGKDYAGAEGTLVIPQGSSQGEVRVRILGDATREDTEALEIRFADATGARFDGDTAARITIVDDDGGRGLLGLFGSNAKAGGDDALDLMVL